VSSDRRIGGIKDRPRPHHRLGSQEQVFDLQQVAISQDRLQRRNLCVGAENEDAVEARRLGELAEIDLRNSATDSSRSGRAPATPALLTRPASRSPASLVRTSAAAVLTATSSVTSKRSGTKRSPNSLDRRSASDVFRTLPKTRNPRSMRTLVVPQPMPVDVPVITTLPIQSPLPTFASGRGRNDNLRYTRRRALRHQYDVTNFSSLRLAHSGRTGIGVIVHRTFRGDGLTDAI